ncbi:MAG: sigma-70 family RNA polymerase sigma factor [Phycisphaerales bacterium]|nr:sigma-70 family RNA polymerase sigma factor [Phycisphaerales bacterium]
MGVETTQPSLLSRVRDAADLRAWTEFEAKYRDLILLYCRRRGLQQSDAEDVRQIVMMNLSSALRQFRYCPTRGRFRSYLGRAVRNAITRQAKIRAPGSIDGALLASLEGPGDDDVWEQEWMNHHYRLAMASIRETFDARSLEIFDRLLEGESIRTIAMRFDMSEQAVHKVKQRLRSRLAERIAEQIRDEDDVDD